MPEDEINQNNPQPAKPVTMADKVADYLVMNVPFLIGCINGLGYLADKESDFKTSKTLFDSKINTPISDMDENQKRTLISEIDEWFKDPRSQALIRSGLSNVKQRALPDITGEMLFKRIAEKQAEYIQIMNDVVSGKIVLNNQPVNPQPVNPAPVNPNPMPVNPNPVPVNPNPQVIFQQNQPGVPINNPFVQKDSGDMGMHLLDLNKHDPDFVKEIASFNYDTDPEIAMLYADIMNVSTMPRDRLFDERDIQNNTDLTYDGRVKDIYKRMNDIIKKHPKEMSDQNSSVNKIASFKAKFFDQGSLKIGSMENALIVDATGKNGTSLNNIHQSKDPVYIDGDQIERSVENIRFKSCWDVQNKGDRVVMKDCSNEPLFTREPHFSDIRQGNVGDCYFVAYMSSLAKSDPQAIKDMMKDNHDGTVTCRFYCNSKPVYVTVNKTVPHVVGYDGKLYPSNGENNPLWLDIAEKAFKMSGIRRFAENIGAQDHALFLKTYKKRCNNPFMSDNEAKMGIFRECYGYQTPYNETLYKKLLTHSNLAFASGKAAELVTGIQRRRTSGAIIRTIKPGTLFSSLGTNAEPMMSDRDKELNPKEKEIVNKMKYYVAKDLQSGPSLYKRRFALEGGLERMEYVRFASVSVEDLTEGFMGIMNNHGFDLCNDFPDVSPDILFNVAQKYASFVDDYHRNRSGNSIFPFRAEGVYTKYANDTYNTMAQLAKDGIPAQVGMGGHAFSLIGVEERDNKKYVILRNPWGKMGLVGNHNARDLSTGNGKLKGAFEMELNEFVAKADDYEFAAEQTLLVDDLHTMIADEYIDILASNIPVASPEEFKKKCKENKEIYRLIRQSHDVQTCLTNSSGNTVEEDFKQNGRIKFDDFKSLSEMTDESMKNLYNQIQPLLLKPAAPQENKENPVRQQAEPVRPNPAPAPKPQPNPAPAPKPQPNPAPAPKPQPNPAPQEPVQNPVAERFEESLGARLSHWMNNLSGIVRNDKRFNPVRDVLNTLTAPGESGQYTKKDLSRIGKAYELLETYQDDLEKMAQNGIDCDDDIASLYNVMNVLDNMELEAKEVLSAVGNNKLGHNMSVLGAAGKNAKTPTEALTALKLVSGKNLRSLAYVERSELQKEYASIMVCDKYLDAIAQGKPVDIQNFDKDVAGLLADKQLMDTVFRHSDIESSRQKMLKTDSPKVFKAEMDKISKMLENDRRTVSPDNKLDKQFEEPQNRNQGIAMV